MKGIALIFFALAPVLTIAAATQSANHPNRERLYTAPDRGLRVVIVPVSKELGRSEYENRIEFKAPDDTLLCALDYSSEDSEHGFGVVKAEWTPDSQYFVFSLTSSGGHQAWHTPTQFLSRKDGIIRSLDDYLGGAGISKSGFVLVAPNTVKTEVWERKSIPVSVELAHPPQVRPRRKFKPLVISCGRGRIFRPEEP